MMLHQIMERFDRIDDRLNRMNRQTAALEGDKLTTRICASSLVLPSVHLHATARRNSSPTT